MLRADRIVINWSKALPQYVGRDLADIATELEVSPEAAAARLQPAGAIYFSMDKQDVRRILGFEDTTLGSDGIAHDAKPHPRLWGTFLRVLGHHSCDLGLVSLATAAHKMTGLTAAKFAPADRGVLQFGVYADITIFGAGKIAAATTFDSPTLPARGIASVIVNGTPVWHDGRATGACPGRLLRNAA